MSGAETESLTAADLVWNRACLFPITPMNYAGADQALASMLLFASR